MREGEVKPEVVVEAQRSMPRFRTGKDGNVERFFVTIPTRAGRDAQHMVLFSPLEVQ